MIKLILNIFFYLKCLVKFSTIKFILNEKCFYLFINIKIFILFINFFFIKLV